MINKDEIRGILINLALKQSVSLKAKWWPWVQFTAIYRISAQEAASALKDHDIKVSLRTMQIWQREAIKQLKLPKRAPGPIRVVDPLQDDWHIKYGYPQIEDLIGGWLPVESAPAPASTTNEEESLQAEKVEIKEDESHQKELCPDDILGSITQSAQDHESSF